MKHGSVYQRHSQTCPAPVDGQRPPHRCRGRWAFVLEYGRDSTGKRLQTTRGGFSTKSEAQSALQERVRVLMTDVSVHTLTVGKYLENWLAGKHALKPKTVSLYRDLIRLYLEPHLGGVRLLELRAQHLDTLYASISIGRRGAPLSPATIRRVHAVLRSALASAVKRRLIPYNPAEHIELAAENPRRPKPWTPAQCITFLRAIEGDRLAVLYDLMLVTGLRRGEAIGLRWEDVDMDGEALFIVQQITEVHGKAVVGTPKTKRGARVIPIDEQTVTRLVEHRVIQEQERALWGADWKDSGLVFTREDGSGIRPEYATRHFQKLAARFGLPVIRLHDLRHTNASLALSAGVAMKVVSERLGHSQTSITADLYTHVHQAVGRDAARQIAGVLKPSSRTVPSDFLAETALETSKGGTDEPTNPTTKQAPDRVSAGQGPSSSLSQRARPEGLEPPTF